LVVQILCAFQDLSDNDCCFDILKMPAFVFQVREEISTSDQLLKYVTAGELGI
jgi:hypothetical protein